MTIPGQIPGPRMTQRGDADADRRPQRCDRAVQVGKVEPGAAGCVIQPRDGADHDPVQREPSNAGALPCVEPLDQRAIVRRRSGECRAQAFENRPYEPETRRPRGSEAFTYTSSSLDPGTAACRRRTYAPRSGQTCPREAGVEEKSHIRGTHPVQSRRAADLSRRDMSGTVPVVARAGMSGNDGSTVVTVRAVFQGLSLARVRTSRA